MTIEEQEHYTDLIEVTFCDDSEGPGAFVRVLASAPKNGVPLLCCRIDDFVTDCGLTVEQWRRSFHNGKRMLSYRPVRRLVL